MFYFIICRGMFNNVVYNSADFGEFYDTFQDARTAARNCIYDAEQTFFIYNREG